MNTGHVIVGLDKEANTDTTIYLDRDKNILYALSFTATFN